jgi:multidrug resistance efflux pump
MRKNCRRAAEKLVLFSLAVVSCAACQLGSAAPEPFKLIVPGRVEGAGDIMAIGTAATGTIAELDVREGERVAANQLLVRIQCANIEKELEARKSSLAATEAVRTRVVQGNRPEEIDIGVANVGLAEARSEEAGITLRRALALTEGITITKAQVDQAKRDARITAAQRDEARARLALLRAGSRQEDIQQAQHNRDATKALVDEAAERLGYCSVRAPRDGVVLSTHVTPGQLVSTAIPVTLIRLVDDSKRRVRAEVDERDLSGICVHQPAVVTAPGFPGVQIAAVSESIGAHLGRRTLAVGDHVDGGAGNVRVVMLSLSQDASIWPIGLDVSVSFARCPAAKGGSAN